MKRRAHGVFVINERSEWLNGVRPGPIAPSTDTPSIHIHMYASAIVQCILPSATLGLGLRMQSILKGATSGQLSRAKHHYAIIHTYITVIFLLCRCRAIWWSMDRFSCCECTRHSMCCALSTRRQIIVSSSNDAEVSTSFLMF